MIAQDADSYYDVRMFTRKTKIVCSLGPSSSDETVIQDLILAGMNVARFNFSQGTHESHRAIMETVRVVSRRLGIPVALLLDTKGPEIRTGNVENNGKVTITKGDRVLVTTDDCFTTAGSKKSPARISISWKDAAAKLQSGHHILMADGLLDLEVVDVTGNAINCLAANTAVIGSKKNVNLIGVHAGLPIMGEQDRKDIAFGAEMNVDFVAASFLSYPHEIFEIRKYIDSLDSPIKVIAKIESTEGLENIKEIAYLADGVMVARGDLGVQLPIEEIPIAQKHIISVCRKLGKPVITATQMLESMIVNPRPTRAELTDVANAIFDGTDAVMLSGETAAGAYPVEAVKTMDKVARNVERSEEFRSRMTYYRGECLSGVRNHKENLNVIMSRSGVEVASSVNAKTMVIPTLSGNTARILSAFRPNEPILAITHDEHIERVMQLYWGVRTSLRPLFDETQSMILNAIKAASETGMAGISDKIVLLAGLPINSPYMINTIRVLILGTVLARSNTGGCANPEISRVQGRIVRASNPQEARDKISSFGGEILVCKVLTDDYTPIIRIVSGIICEGISDMSEQKLRDINPNLVWLTHIRHATEKLELGLTVTIDAKQLLVYEGTV
jgi:pyruvate kinase